MKRLALALLPSDERVTITLPRIDSLAICQPTLNPASGLLPCNVTYCPVML